MERNKALLWAILFLELSIGAQCTKIRLLNACPFSIWPAWTPVKGIPQISFGGAKLNPWQSLDLWPPPGWGGQFWARTECAFNATTGKGHCETGNCNGAFGCATSGLPPITIIEFALNGDHNLDFYDVSLLDGFNVPITVTPTNYRCGIAGCLGDINVRCPPELQLRSTITGLVAGCDSPCLAFARDEFCCTGAFSSPYTCRPSSFSLMFKEVCPKALTYPWDREATSFSCPADNDYVIEFCPYNAAHVNLPSHAQA